MKLPLASLVAGLCLSTVVFAGDCTESEEITFRQILADPACSWDTRLRILKSRVEALVRLRDYKDADDLVKSAVDVATQSASDKLLLVPLYLFAADYYAARADQMVPPEFLMPSWNWQLSDRVFRPAHFNDPAWRDLRRSGYADERADLSRVRPFDNMDLVRRQTLYRESVRHAEAVVKLAEKTHGEKDERLIEPLRRLAYIRVLEHRSRPQAEEPLERVVEIVANEDAATRARALVELADIYTITGDKRADDTYLHAWSILSDTEENLRLRKALFESTQLIYPAGGSLPVWYKPQGTDSGESLFCEFEFSISRIGRVHSIKVLECNVSRNSRKLGEMWLRLSFFRPQIYKGEVVGREELQFRQEYQIAGKKW